MTKVSVVCIVYNSMAFLPETVNSVLAQTFQDFELLIVDDGSSDNVVDWVSSLTDPRIRLISQKNQGIPGARNTGIEHSRGKYLAFLDGDDLWAQNKLERQVARLDMQPEAGLIHTAIRFVDKDGKPIQTLGVKGEGDVWERVVCENPVRCGSSPVIRRHCFQTLGTFDPTIFFCDDWDMWIRISSRYHFAVINEPLTFYRQHSNNTSSKYQMIMPNLAKVIDRSFEGKAADYDTLKREAYGRAYLFAAGRALLARDVRLARSLQKKALHSFPSLTFRRDNLRLNLQLMKLFQSTLLNSRMR